MTERKIELPKLSWTAAQRACEGSYRMAEGERTAQLTAALAKIADMEALLREMVDRCNQFDVQKDWVSRVDAMLAEGL